jgi:DNA polymerase (family X)
MMPLDASAVAKLLHEFGQRTALRGGNHYRARAYSRAAENLMVLTVPLEEVVAQDRLKEIPGVGDAIGYCHQAASEGWPPRARRHAERDSGGRA